jgi:hypothetical protein
MGGTSSLHRDSVRNSGNADLSMSSVPDAVGNRRSGVLGGGTGSVHQHGSSAVDLSRTLNYPSDVRRSTRVLPDERRARADVSFIDVGKMASILNSGYYDGASDTARVDANQDSNPQLQRVVPLWIQIM